MIELIQRHTRVLNVTSTGANRSVSTTSTSPQRFVVRNRTLFFECSSTALDAQHNVCGVLPGVVRIWPKQVCFYYLFMLSMTNILERRANTQLICFCFVLFHFNNEKRILSNLIEMHCCLNVKLPKNWLCIMLLNHMKNTF